MENKNVDDYINEYAHEIENEKVDIEHLNKCGISNDVLAAEVYLYKNYGDEIVIAGAGVDEVDEKKKTVQKIGEEEKNINNEFRNVIDEIENSEFDKNLEVLMKK